MQSIPLAGTDQTLGGERPFLIAEIGKGFIQTKEDQSIETYLENAKRLVDAAKAAGADAVKFQTHNVEDEQLQLDITSPHFADADRYSWVKRNTEATPVEAFWKPLVAHSKEVGILFFTTPMSRGAAEKMCGFDLPLWKVSSGDAQDNLMLDYLAATRKPIIISTGMVSYAELDTQVARLRSRDVPLVIMYCISKYPAPQEYFNLTTIKDFAARYPDCIIGFSDHSLGDHVSLAAAALGAQVIEKHFSLSREAWGSDHKVSMLPDEFKRLAETIRSGAYRATDPTPYLGQAGKELEGAHNEFRPYFNKILVAAHAIASGDRITERDVYAMRPKRAGEMTADLTDRVIGKHAVRALEKYEPISEDDLVSL